MHRALLPALMLLAWHSPGEQLLAQDPEATTTVQQPDVVRTYLEYVSNAYFDTPGNQGLLPTAIAEVRIAAQHVRLAGQDSTMLGAMRGNMTHVLHALDPSEARTGSGLGYGVRRAAVGAAEQLEMLASTEGASDNIRMHATYAASAARAAQRRVDDAVATARRVQSATSASEANALVRRLAGLVRAIQYGLDADRDGRIGVPDSEAGLAQAAYHLTLLRRVEALGR